MVAKVRATGKLQIIVAKICATPVITFNSEANNHAMNYCITSLHRDRLANRGASQ